MKALLVALVLACSAAQAQDDFKNRKVKIINKTSETMLNFYATRVGVKSWGRDRLGNEILYRNYEIELDIRDGTNACRFDLRAVFDNGQESTRYDFDVCVESSLTFRD